MISSFKTLFAMKLLLVLVFSGLCYSQAKSDLEPKTVEQAALTVARYISALAELGLGTDGDELVRNITSDGCYCPLSPSDDNGHQYFTGVLPIQSSIQLQNLRETLSRNGGEVVGASHQITVRSGDGGIHHIDAGPIDPAHISGMLAAGGPNMAPENMQGQGMQHDMAPQHNFGGHDPQHGFMNPQIVTHGPQPAHDLHAPQMFPSQGPHDFLTPQYPSPQSSHLPNGFDTNHLSMHDPFYSQGTAQSSMDPRPYHLPMHEPNQWPGTAQPPMNPHSPYSPTHEPNHWQEAAHTQPHGVSGHEGFGHNTAMYGAPHQNMGVH